MNPWPVDAEVEESHLPRPGHADLVGSQKFGHSRRPQRARARERARDRGPRRRRRRSRRSSSPRSASASTATCSGSPRSSAPERRRARPGGLRRRRRVARPLPRPRGRASDGRRDRPAAKGEREPRRDLRGARLRARPGPRLARLLGRAPRRPPRAGAWSRSRRSRASRSARRGRSPACPARSPTTRSSGRRSAATYRETNRAGGVEGGMSNGEPLVVRGALKPISTLTQPLRSVDTETKEPAEAMRERTDSTVVPAAGVVGRGDGRPRARALLPREVRRRPHRRRSRRRCRPTGSASIGAAEREAPGARLHRLHGGGQVEGARGRPRRSASRRPTPTTLLEARAGQLDRGVLRRRGRGRSSARREEALVPELLERVRRRDRARRRRGALASGSARRSPTTSSSGCGSRPTRPGSASRDASARWRATATRFAALLAEREPLYEALADAVLPAGDAERRAARCRRCSRSRELPAGPRLAWARAHSGEYPAFVGRGAAELLGGRATGLAARRPAVLRHRRDRRRALYADALEPLGGPDRGRARRGGEDARRGRAGAARAGRAGVTRSRPRRRARRRRRRRPRRASAPRSTSAGSRWSRCRRRSSPRSTPPTAARPASTCPRPRTTSAPTTCRPRCSPIPRRSTTLPGAGARRRASPRW